MEKMRKMVFLEDREGVGREGEENILGNRGGGGRLRRGSSWGIERRGRGRGGGIGGKGRRGEE